VRRMALIQKTGGRQRTLTVPRLNQNARSSSSVSTQSLSVSVIQSRAQPSYAGIEPGRKVLTRESPITIFAELTDKLAETCGHFWLFAKQDPQTCPYLSANDLIVLCVNVQFAHLTARAVSTVWQLAWASLPRSILSAIGLNRVR
jgi:hypothetical protein